jgi:transposase
MNVIPEAQPQPQPQHQHQQYPLPVSSAQHPPVCMDLVPAASASASTAASAATPSQDPSVTKEQLKDHLRQWVRVENEISTLSAEIKKRKLIHQQLSASLLRVMKENEIDCFDIANGRIVYSKTKSRAPLNNGQLKSALKTYYKEDTEKANSLAEFLLASRVERTRETIKMKIPKIK